MAKDHPPPHTLVGGRLCLDFCNTVSDRAGTPVDRLHDYADLVGWAWRAGILNAEEAARLRRLSARNPTAALAVLRRALALREGIHGIFSTLAAGGAPPQSRLELLNAELASALSRSQVVATDAGFAWVWSEGGRALDCMLWPIARSAADLLTGGELLTVRECRGETCGRLFLDTSRNRTRVWCDMKVCGNRAKARRHHKRVRAGAA